MILALQYVPSFFNPPQVFLEPWAWRRRRALMAESYSGLYGDSERLARKAAQAAQRQTARTAQAQLDLAKAKEYGEGVQAQLDLAKEYGVGRPLVERNAPERDAVGGSPSAPASARRARGQEARDERVLFERVLAKTKGREALEEEALLAQLELIDHRHEAELREQTRKESEHRSAEAGTRLQRKSQQRVKDRLAARAAGLPAARAPGAPAAACAPDAEPVAGYRPSESGAIQCKFDSFLRRADRAFPPPPAAPPTPAASAGPAAPSLAEEAERRLERALREYEAEAHEHEALSLHARPAARAGTAGAGATANAARGGGSARRRAARPPLALEAEAAAAAEGAAARRGTASARAPRADAPALPASMLTHKVRV